MLNYYPFMHPDYTEKDIAKSKTSNFNLLPERFKEWREAWNLLFEHLMKKIKLEQYINRLPVSEAQYFDLVEDSTTRVDRINSKNMFKKSQKKRKNKFLTKNQLKNKAQMTAQSETEKKIEMALEFYNPPILGSVQLVCILCDMVSSDLNEKSISNLYRGQVGVVEEEIYETDSVGVKALESNLSPSLPLKKVRGFEDTENRYYSVTFLDAKRFNGPDDDWCWQTLIVNRNDLVGIKHS